MNRCNPQDLINKFPIVSDQIERDELHAVLRELARSLEAGAEGSVVEFGCYVGTTSLFIRRLLDASGSNSELHVYDSFQGLPNKSNIDISPLGEQFTAGELLATKRQLIDFFKKAHLRLPVIHKGWFNELTDDDVPERIMFAFLDGDYYESIMTPLNLIDHKLDSRAIIVVDDYGNQALPGARKAVDQWLRTHPQYLLTEQSSLAILRPRT